jgi:hypothetical protein
VSVAVAAVFGALGGVAVDRAAGDRSDPSATFGIPIGVVTYDVSDLRLPRQRIAIIDDEGRSRVCAEGVGLDVLAAVVGGGILFEDYEDRPGAIFVVDSGCTREPRRILSLTREHAASDAETGCVGLRPGSASLEGVVVGGASRSGDGFGDLLGSGQAGSRDGWIRVHGRSCLWVDDRHAVSGRGTWPYVTDAFTGELSFFAEPARLTGVLSPDGALSYSPWGNEGAIIDIATGSVIGNVPPGADTLPEEAVWAPGSERLLVPGGGSAPTVVFDVNEGVVAQFDSKFFEDVDWLADDLVVRSRRHRVEILRVPGGSPTRVDLTGWDVGALQHPFVDGFVPRAPTLPLEIVKQGELALRDLGVLGVKAPIPPRWSVVPCGAHRCSRNNIGFDVSVRPDDRGEALNFLPGVSLASSRDAVSDVVAELTRGASRRCPVDDRPVCVQFRVDEAEVHGRRFVNVDLRFWEGHDSFAVTRLRGRTLILRPSIHDAGPVVGFLYRSMQFG